MPTLDLATRSRVTARVYITKGLRIVPGRVSSAIRDRHMARPSPMTARAAGLLRHRSIAHLDTFSFGDVRLVAVDTKITRRLYWYGEAGYEPGESAAWREACRKATRIVEIGANIGYYTVQGALAAPDTPYVCVEAHPDSAAIVARNVALNGLTNVQVVHAAVVADPSVESIELALPDEEQYLAPTAAFLATGTEGVGERRASQRTIPVPATGAAALLDGADLVKLDIEGAEHQVLEESLPGLIDRGATLFVEVIGDTPQLREQLTLMMKAGYEANVITDAAPSPITAEDLRDADFMREFGSRDVILSPTSAG
jgi:FkbM family methyltransferase